MTFSQFIQGIFTDKDGGPSSKRAILFMLVVTFLICVFVNLFSGKSLSDTLAEQLFYLVLYALASVFGEGITKIFANKSKEAPKIPSNDQNTPKQ